VAAATAAATAATATAATAATAPPAATAATAATAAAAAAVPPGDTQMSAAQADGETVPAGLAPFTSFPSKAAAAAAPSASALDVLRYCRSLSVNLVPLRDPAYSPTYPGNLISDSVGHVHTTLSIHQRFLALVFVSDPRSRVLRQQAQHLPPHQRDMPLLPHWIFASPGQGASLHRSTLLTDVIPNSRAAGHSAELEKMERDPGQGVAVDGNQESTILDKYRKE
jgi:hypothetical protein